VVLVILFDNTNRATTKQHSFVLPDGLIASFNEKSFLSDAEFQTAAASILKQRIYWTNTRIIIRKRGCCIWGKMVASISIYARYLTPNQQ